MPRYALYRQAYRPLRRRHSRLQKIHCSHRPTSFAAGLCRIAPDGTISLLANDFQDARGVAVDVPRHLLYAIDRAGSTGGTSYVRIFPLN